MGWFLSTSPNRAAKHHGQGVGGVCRECVLAEIEQAIADEHPELERGEVFEVEQEWLMRDSNPRSFV